MWCIKMFGMQFLATPHRIPGLILELYKVVSGFARQGLVFPPSFLEVLYIKALTRANSPHALLKV